MTPPKASSEAETPAAHPLPPSGGSWIRQPDGSLVREAGTEPAKPGVPDPLQDDLKEL